MKNNTTRYWQFWQRLNRMPHSKYTRAQKLCTRYLGGWVRGINIIDGKVTLNIE